MRDKYLKHEQPTQKTRKPIKKQPQSVGMDSPDCTEGLLVSCAVGELAESVDKIGRTVADYAHNATLGENSLGLHTGPNSYPLRLVLEGAAVDKIADALSRIAAAMEKKA
jgi:hypothetical protein